MITWRMRPMSEGGILEIHDAMTGMSMALMFRDLGQLAELLEDMLDAVRNAKLRETTSLDSMSEFVKEFPEMF